MATVNNNKPVDMKQLWQQVEPAPTISTAVSGITTSEDGDDRYIYYLVASTFYRYDTYGNAWQRLANPATAPASLASLRYSKYGGQFGRVIAQPSATTLRIAGLNGGIFVGNTIRIIAGAGTGQVRTITAHAEAVKYEQGLATVASTSQIGDSTKKWKFNQWAGYQVRLTYAAGATQVRKILYNDTTTLTVSDVNYQSIDPFNNQPFAVAPVVTAGSQTHFVIEANDITVNSAWTTAPDYTSRYKIESGGVWLFSSAAAAPFAQIQYYDVAGDYWMNKTVPTSVFLAAFGTDGTLERTGEIGGVYETGTASSGGNYVLTDTTKTLTIDKYTNYRVRITDGTGVGQSRRICANGVDYFEVARKWDTNPDATSVYQIIADKDKFYIAGNAQASLTQYDVDADLIILGAKSDDGVANNLGCRLIGFDQPTIAITSGTRGVNGITSIAPAPGAGGSGYIVGDILTVSGGTNGKVMVTSTSPTGIVTGLTLIRAGTGYTVATVATTGGTGTGCTVVISTIGTICNVVTAINHHLKIGDQIVLSGDALYAGTVTIIGNDALNGFDFATGAAGNMTPASTNAATLIVDSTKNWTTNEHVGKIVQTHLVGLAGAVQPRVITANTATTITVATFTTPLVNGTGRYVIVDQSSFGRDEQFKDPNKAQRGIATGGSTTTLIDSTKNWNTNQWAGARIRIKAGTGRDAYFTVTSNTATTLTYAAQGFTPDSTTRYSLQDSFGTCTGAGSTTTLVDTTKTWAVNQWAGKRVRITGGAGFGLAAALNEILIVSNTANTLTFTAITGFAPDATTTYTILGVPVRGAGIQLVWLFGGVSAGRYMLCPRGGISNTFDRYDVTTEVWEYGFLISPQSDTLTTGSYYAYDGGDRLYFSPGVATGIVQHVMYYDLIKNRVFAFGAVPNTQLAPVIGNRMEIVNSPAGIAYLYHMRNTGAEIYRAQIFF